MSEEKPTINDCFIKAVELYCKTFDLLINVEKLKVKEEK